MSQQDTQDTREDLIRRGLIVPSEKRAAASVDAPTLRLDDTAKRKIARQHFTCSGGCGAQTLSPYADGWTLDGPLTWCTECERRSHQ